MLKRRTCIDFYWHDHRDPSRRLITRRRKPTEPKIPAIRRRHGMKCRSMASTLRSTPVAKPSSRAPRNQAWSTKSPCDWPSTSSGNWATCVSTTTKGLACRTIAPLRPHGSAQTWTRLCHGRHQSRRQTFRGPAAKNDRRDQPDDSEDDRTSGGLNIPPCAAAAKDGQLAGPRPDRQLRRCRRRAALGTRVPDLRPRIHLLVHRRIPGADRDDVMPLIKPTLDSFEPVAEKKPAGKKVPQFEFLPQKPSLLTTSALLAIQCYVGTTSEIHGVSIGRLVHLITNTDLKREITLETSVRDQLSELGDSTHVSNARQKLDKFVRELVPLARPGDRWWEWVQGTEPLMQQGGLALVRDGEIIWATMTWIS